jgi:hypothetical protein
MERDPVVAEVGIQNCYKERRKSADTHRGISRYFVSSTSKDMHRIINLHP